MRLILLFSIFSLLSCNPENSSINKNDSTIAWKPAPLLSYLKIEHGIGKSGATEYLLLVSSRQCKLCTKGNLNRLNDVKPLLKCKQVLLLTDYSRSDTILTGIRFSNFVSDSSARYMLFDFPKSFVTLYKIKNDSVLAYAHLEDEVKFDSLARTMCSDN